MFTNLECHREKLKGCGAYSSWGLKYGRKQHVKSMDFTS